MSATLCHSLPLSATLCRSLPLAPPPLPHPPALCDPASERLCRNISHVRGRGCTDFSAYARRRLSTGPTLTRRAASAGNSCGHSACRCHRPGAREFEHQPRRAGALRPPHLHGLGGVVARGKRTPDTQLGVLWVCFACRAYERRWGRRGAANSARRSGLASTRG
jgi:hypothetical protein